MSVPVYVGLDVAKAHIEAAVWPEPRAWRVAHTESALAELVEQMQRDITQAEQVCATATVSPR